MYEKIVVIIFFFFRSSNSKKQKLNSFQRPRYAGLVLKRWTYAKHLDNQLVVAWNERLGGLHLTIDLHLSMHTPRFSRVNILISGKGNFL